MKLATFTSHEPVRINGWDEHEEWQEIEANEFAAGLLMPASRVYTLASYHRHIPRLLDEMQRFFRVSMQAAARRITMLDIFRGAIMLTNQAETEARYRYSTPDFYDDSAYNYHFKRRVAPDRMLHVFVAETYRHLVKAGIG